MSYRIDDRDPNGNLIPHGYVCEWDLGIPVIRQQLAQMYQNGQRRLGIAVPYHSAGDTFALACGTGLLVDRDRRNLTGLIRDAIDAGFEELLIEMIPEWDMAYTNWENESVMGPGNARPFQPLKYGTLLSFTADVWETAKAAAAGRVDVYIDLLGECGNATVGARLWSDWCALYPDPNDLATALGFSQVPVQASFDLILKLYTNGRQPSRWNVHAYNGAEEMTWSDYKAALMHSYWQGIIIGETSCNDPALAAAISADTDGLFWLLQWPVVTGVTPDNIAQDRLTIDYNAYSSVGL